MIARLLLLRAVLSFGAAVATGLAYAMFSRRAVSGSPHVAGVWNAAIGVCNLINIANAITTPWMVIPSMLGWYLGPVLAIRRDTCA